ncbi:YwaF family protein [Alkalibacillus aidingensis]|uniref:YwaF family protein n=1 Tax=Alkalibacillus aidingensis TaxID=2747607 RepID=UPI001660713D|nr:TIGR02206 family membrane protein [Alkalibacillus aidingensis]
MWGLIGFNRGEYPFELFSLSHLTMLFLTFLLAFALYNYRKTIAKRYKKDFTVVLVTVLVLSELTFHLWFWIHGEWSVTVNLPLQLSSISLYLCAFMLLTKNYRIFEVTFFISMTGGIMAMITPELYFGFPHMRFFQFFIAHFVIILACLYMFWVEKYHPTLKSVLRAFVALNVIALLVYGVNQLIGSNYMFLNGKPSSTTLLDYLGPYPWYILSLEGITIILFLVIYGMVVITSRGKRG